MRIAIGQLWQETNTFNPLPTTRENFEQFGVSRGAQMVTAMAETNELGGFIQTLRRWPEPPEIVGLARLPAWPSGLVTAETFAWLRDELTSALESSLPVDAVLLALHGSMAAEQHPDVEGEILEAVRTIVGPHVPVVATLDLHANVTRKMVAHADALVLYHTAPHIDVFETGVRGANVLRRILLDGVRPTTSFVKVPAVFPAERANTQAATGVSTELKTELQQLERHPEILTAGVATVQPWLDIPEFGSAVLVTTVNNPLLADATAGQLAQKLWDRRQEYMPELVSVAAAVSHAQSQHARGLVVLSDAADATTSGAPGDSVWLLQELLKYEWQRPVLVTIVSPETVATLQSEQPGAAIDVQLGGVRDHRFGTSLRFTGNFVRAFDASFVLNGHLGKNMPITMGRSVVLQQHNVFVIVTSQSGPHFAPELFQAAGFDPFSAAVVVAKSPCGFRAVYEQHAVAIYSVRAPGCAPSNFWEYPFHNIERPLWPWDEPNF